MPVASSRIKNGFIEPYSGRFRARYIVTMDDGREVEIGPIQRTTPEDITDFLLIAEARALKKVQADDAQDAVKKDITVAHRQASREQVAKVYLMRGIDARDVESAYRALKPVQTALEGSKTDTELAAMLDVRERDVFKARDRWTRLKAKSTEIDAYRAVKVDG